MTCQTCKSTRIAKVNAKCDDRCNFSVDYRRKSDYVPRKAGLGSGGDYLQMDYCLNCGQIQGKFPVPILDIEEEDSEEPEKNADSGSLFGGDGWLEEWANG